MKKLKRVIYSVLCAFLLASAATAAQEKSFDLEKTKEILETKIKKALKDKGIPSISVSLVAGDKIIWNTARGYTNMKTKSQATPDSIYFTGSTYKAVTSTAIMVLVEQGKLKLDDPVNSHLGRMQIKDRLQSEKPVTIRHILNHTSGLLNNTHTEELWGRIHPGKLDDMVSGLYTIRAPEEKYEYNNAAFALAGFIIEKVSGMDLEDFINEHVFKPIGATTMGSIYPTPQMIELMALPYNVLIDGSAKPVPQIRFDVYPAGDTYTTAEDMARFIGVHINGGEFNGNRILTEESMAKLHTAQSPGLKGIGRSSDIKESSYGFGWNVKKDDKGHTIISHSGGASAGVAYMLGDLNAKVGAYAMTNSMALDVLVDLSETAVKLMRGEEYVLPEEPKIVSVSPGILKTYVGKYQIAPDEIVVISVKGDRIYVKGPDQPVVEIFAISESEFFVKTADIKLKFVKNDQNKVDTLLIDFMKTKMKAKRIE